MEKFVYYNNLFLLYQELLNPRNKEIFNLYYGENLSMQEIADMNGVSKSYVGSLIKQTEKRLEDYENKLHLYKKSGELEKLLEIEDMEKLRERLKEIIKE